MTGRYLRAVDPASVGGNPSVATASVGPSVGEFWVPSLITVSTQAFIPNDGTGPISDLGIMAPHCTLYYGPSGVLSQSQIVDDTYLGSGDQSSILSATVVQFGEQITAVWSQPDGLPIFNDTLLTVYGRAFSSLQELQDNIPPIPGAKFSGSTGNAVQWQYRGFLNTASQAIADNLVLFTPKFTQVELINVQFQVDTSAIADNRSLGVQALGALPGTSGTSVNIFRSFASATQPASTTVTYDFLSDGPTYAPGTGTTMNYGINLPSKAIIPVGFNLVLRVRNPHTGDLVSNIQGVYRQLNNVSKVTYL